MGRSVRSHRTLLLQGRLGMVCDATQQMTQVGIGINTVEFASPEEPDDQSWHASAVEI